MILLWLKEYFQFFFTIVFLINDGFFTLVLANFDEIVVSERFVFSLLEPNSLFTVVPSKWRILIVSFLYK